MFLKFNKITLTLLFISTILNAQIQQDSIFKLNSTNLSTSYNKILNIHNFNSLIHSSYELDNFSFQLENRFNSNIIFSTIKNIRDDNYFALKGQYKFSNFIQPSISIESKRINDNRKVGISRFKDFAIKGWINSNPYSSFYISPFYGYKEEEQLEIGESGKTFGLTSNFDENILKSKLMGNLKLVYDYLNIRKNQMINTEFLIENFFSEVLNTTTRFYFNKIGRDYFTSIDSNTARIFNTTYNLENRLDNVINFSQRFDLTYPSGFALEISGDIFYRTVDKNLKFKNLNEPNKNLFDTKINEFKFNVSGESRIPLGSVFSIFKFAYQERSEKHSVKRIQSIPDYIYYQRLDEELQKNNFSSRVTFGTQNKINIISRDTLVIDASISKLRYDTPPLENFTNPVSITRDDRDELLYIIRLQYLRFFNPALITTILLESFNNHLVYIFKERSSNNNWNRVLRLSTSTTYQSKKFTTKNYFEVLANYTIYDFEDLFQTTQSFAFRQFGFQDSTKIFLIGKYFLAANFNLKLSEQGVFYWKKFSSLPGRYLNEQEAELKIGRELSEINFIALGIRSTLISEFNFKGKEKQTVFEMRSVGPLLEGYLYYKKDFYVNLKCWIEYIQQSNQIYKRNINLSFSSYLIF